MKTRPLPTLTLLAVLALAGLAPSPAWAASPPEDKAAAQALFEEGKRLMDESKYDEACVKFEESQKLDHGMGTQYHLASCYEKIGRTASAWALFVEVAAAARAAGMEEREEVARGRAEALEPKLARLTIAPPREGVEDLVIQRDGVIVGRGQWDVAVPVDPGEHTVTATAPGRKPWRMTVRVPDEATTVTIPSLAEAEALRGEGDSRADKGRSSRPSAPEVPTSGAAPAQGGLGPLRITGLIAGGLGVVGLGVGTALGVAAKSKQEDSNASCSGNLCTAAGTDLRRDAMGLADGSTAAFIAGGALLSGGVALFLLAPSATVTTGRHVTVSPVAGARGVGVLLGGRL